MDTIGEQLKRKREELGLSIEQAAEATKFRPEMIEAVEEGRAGVFSAGVYRDGFIRTYAALLKLDGDSLLRAEKTEEERAHEAIRGIKLRPPRRRIPSKVLAIIIAAAAAGIVAAILITRVGGDGQTAEGQSGASQLREVTSTTGLRAKQPSQARRRGQGAPGKDSLGEAGADSLKAAGNVAGYVGGKAAADTFVAPPTTSPNELVWPVRMSQAGMDSQASQLTEAGQPSPGGEVSQAGPSGPSGLSGPAGQAGAITLPSRSQGAQAAPGPLVAQVQGAGDVAVTKRAGGPAAESGPAGTGPGQPGASPAQPAAGSHTLEITASRSSYFTIRSAGRVIFNEYKLGRGQRVRRTDTGPFFIEALSDRQGVSITVDGQPVRLPLSDDPALFDWQIPSNP